MRGVIGLAFVYGFVGGSIVESSVQTGRVEYAAIAIWTMGAFLGVLGYINLGDRP